MHPKGFTLIEVLIYMALMAVMLLGMVQLTTSIFDLRARTRSGIVLEENLRFALVSVAERVKAAADITSPGAGSSDSLTLDMVDATLDPTTFSLANGILMITEGASGAGRLTSSEVEVTTFTVTRLAGTPPSVRLLITGQLRNATGPYQSVLSISTTAVVRR